MAFADPQSVTYNTVAKSMPRTGTSLSEGTFMDANREFSLVIRHSFGSRYRHLAQLKMDSIVSNPLVPDQNFAVSAHAHLVIDAPKNGLTATEVTDLAKAIVTWATPANIAKLVAGEN